MAMGISTQSGPLKPCCPTFIWVAPTSHFASMPSSSSSHAVSTSAKALHRRELHFLHSADGHCCSITGFRSSSQFKLNSSYSLIMNNSACMFDRTKSHWRLVVRAEQRRSSTSSAQMFPYSEREMAKNKNMHRRLHEPPTTEKEVIPPYWSSDHWTPTDVTSPLVAGSKADWCKESYKLKIAKELNKSMSGKNSIGIPLEQNIVNSKKPGLNCLQDGSGFEKNVSFDSINRLRLEHVAVHGDYRSSFSRESIGEMQSPRLPSMQPSSNVEIGSGKGRGVGVTNLASYKDNALRLTASNKQVFRCRNNNYNSMQAGSFTAHDIQCNGTLLHEKGLLKTDGGILNGAIETNPSYKKSDSNSDLNKNDVEPTTTKEECSIPIQKELRKKLCHIYDKVIVVDNVISAKKVVGLLTEKYRHLVHACDTEVANIDVKEETPVDHGEIICFSIYSGPEADFGDGKSCIWVDVLDGGMDLLMEFAPFFEDPLIKKVWHNYSFDSHVIENYGLKISGFHADTMHMARLWDSSRRLEGGYSLEALTSDSMVMSETKSSAGEGLIGKFSMKTIFGKRKIKKDGFEGKIITIAPVEELQREERVPWICYSALDSISTLKLFNSMRSKLMAKKWHLDGKPIGSMYNFYEKYWRPFGKLLVKMEAEGMLVDRAYLSEMEKLAIMEQGVAASRFRKWASKHCTDAFYMNVGSDAQLRQLFFGGMKNRKDPTQDLPKERKFKVLNVDKIIEEGKKVPTKFRTIKLHSIVDDMQTEMYTSAGWPSVCGDALKIMAGKVSSEYDWNDEEIPLAAEVDSPSTSENVDTSLFGTAYAAFGGKKGGREACHAIAALCEVCSIDSLISNFILPLQSSVISGKDGRIHCSLNINTETGRLSARRPNLQNQPALEKDRYKIRQAFIAAPGKSLIVADYGQLELRILAHVANCKSMLNAFEAGGDFHSRTAMNMYPHIRRAVEQKQVLLEWHPQPGEDKPPAPLLKDAFASERRKAKMLNFSIAYGKTPVGLARDWKVSIEEAKETVNLWYKERKEVLQWQRKQKHEAKTNRCVHTLLGRARMFPSIDHVSNAQRGHIERAAINTPVQGSAADVAMCAMLEISRNPRLKELGWKLLLQVHDEVILEGPTESAEEAKAIVVECMSKPFEGKNILNVDLAVDAKCAQNWYAAK